MNKVYAIIGVILGVVIFGGLMMFAGYSFAQRGKAEAVVTQLKEDNDAVIEIREVVKWRTKEVTKYVDVIKEVVDTSGCLDMPVPDAVSDELFKAYSPTP